MDLLEGWANWEPRSPRLVFDGDGEILNSERSGRAVVVHEGWRRVIQTPDSCAPDDRRLHLAEAIVIVTRKVAAWNLAAQPGVVTYNPVQAWAAHLTPESPGGRAILNHLGVSL